MASIITSNGLNNFAKIILGLTGLTELYLEVGTGTQSVVVGVTALTTPLSPRVALVNSVAGAVATLQAFFSNSQVNGTITEWGIFDQLTGGTCLAYGTFSPSVAKTAALTMTIPVIETLSNG